MKHPKTAPYFRTARLFIVIFAFAFSLLAGAELAAPPSGDPIMGPAGADGLPPGFLPLTALEQIKRNHAELIQNEKDLVAKYDSAQKKIRELEDRLAQYLNADVVTGTDEYGDQLEAELARLQPDIANFVDGLLEIESKRAQIAFATGALKATDFASASQVAEAYPATKVGKAAYDAQFAAPLLEILNGDETKRQELAAELAKIDPAFGAMAEGNVNNDGASLVAAYDFPGMARLRIDALRSRAAELRARKQNNLYFPKSSGEAISDTLFPASAISGTRTASKASVRPMLNAFLECSLNRQVSYDGRWYPARAAFDQQIAKAEAFAKECFEAKRADSKFDCYGHSDALGEATSEDRKHLRTLLGEDPKLPLVLNEKDADIYRAWLQTSFLSLLNGTAVLEVDQIEGTVKTVSCDFKPENFSSVPTAETQTKVFNSKSKYFYVTLSVFTQLVKDAIGNTLAVGNGGAEVGYLRSELNQQAQANLSDAGLAKSREALLIKARQKVVTDLFPENWAQIATVIDEKSRTIVSDTEAKRYLLNLVQQTRAHLGETLLSLQEVITKNGEVAEQVWKEAGLIGRAVYEWRLLPSYGKAMSLTQLAPLLLVMENNVDPADDPRGEIKRLKGEIATALRVLNEKIQKVTLYDVEGREPLSDDELAKLPRLTGGGVGDGPSLANVLPSAANLLVAKQFRISLRELGSANFEEGIAGGAFQNAKAISTLITTHAATIQALDRRLGEGVAVFKMAVLTGIVVVAIATGGTASPLVALYAAGTQISFCAVVAGVNNATGMPASRAWGQFGIDTASILAGGAAGMGMSVLAFRALAGIGFQYAAMGLGAKIATNFVVGGFAGASGGAAAHLTSFCLARGRLPQSDSEWREFAYSIALSGAMGSAFATLGTLSQANFGKGITPTVELAPPSNPPLTPRPPPGGGQIAGTSPSAPAAGPMQNSPYSTGPPSGGNSYYRVAVRADGKTVRVIFEEPTTGTNASPAPRPNPATAPSELPISAAEATALGLPAGESPASLTAFEYTKLLLYRATNTGATSSATAPAVNNPQTFTPINPVTLNTTGIWNLESLQAWLDSLNAPMVQLPGPTPLTTTGGWDLDSLKAWLESLNAPLITIPSAMPSPTLGDWNVAAAQAILNGSSIAAYEGTGLPPVPAPDGSNPARAVQDEQGNWFALQDGEGSSYYELVKDADSNFQWVKRSLANATPAELSWLSAFAADVPRVAVFDRTAKTWAFAPMRIVSMVDIDATDTGEKFLIDRCGARINDLIRTAKKGEAVVVVFQQKDGTSTRFLVTGHLGSGGTTHVVSAVHLGSKAQGALRLALTGEPQITNYQKFFLNGHKEATALGLPIVDVIAAPARENWPAGTIPWILVERMNIVNDLGNYILQGEQSLPNGFTHKDVMDAMEVFSRKAANAMRVGYTDLHAGNLVLVQNDGKLKFSILDIAVSDRSVGNAVYDPAQPLSAPLVHEGSFDLRAGGLGNERWESLSKLAFRVTVEERARLNPNGKPADRTAITLQSAYTVNGGFGELFPAPVATPTDAADSIMAAGSAALAGAMSNPPLSGWKPASGWTPQVNDEVPGTVVQGAPPQVNFPP